MTVRVAPHHFCSVGADAGDVAKAAATLHEQLSQLKVSELRRRAHDCGAVLRNLKLSDLSEVAKYANPPAGVKLVMEAMHMCFGYRAEFREKVQVQVDRNIKEFRAERARQSKGEKA